MKTDKILFFTIMLILTVFSVSGQSAGDVNSSGGVDIVDALLIAQYYVNLPVSNFNSSAADVDCNGNINIVDALMIAQYYVGLVTDF